MLDLLNLQTAVSPRLEIDVMNAPSRLLATKQLPLRGAERGTGAVGRGRELGRQLNLDRRLCLAEIQFEVARARYTPTRRDTPGETATATLNELNVVRRKKRVASLAAAIEYAHAD